MNGNIGFTFGHQFDIDFTFMISLSLSTMNIHCAKALMGFDYELYEAPDKKFGSMSEVVI